MAEFHPATVHFPIAFFLLWPILDSVGLYFERPDVGRVAAGVLVLALFCALLSTLSGQAAFDQAVESGTQVVLLERHTLDADLVPWLALVVLLVRSVGVHKFGKRALLIAIAMGVALAGFVIAVGLSGGDLVFLQRIGVASPLRAIVP